MSKPQENMIKIIILGSSNVGKTCILRRGFDNEFNSNNLSTIGIDFKTKFFKFDEEKIKVNYIDTAGQEKFRAISLNYLKGTD
jgi:Ras-related protein Rab-1A